MLAKFALCGLLVSGYESVGGGEGYESCNVGGKVADRSGLRQIARLPINLTIPPRALLPNDVERHYLIR
jgi:hypothetical protein